ncbi:MAG: MmpS family transport accessory protein [Egibacteraceae bacterium]
MALLLTILVAGCAARPGGDGIGDQTATVVYEVTGSGKANVITYSADESGGMAQETGVALPWRKEVTMKTGFGRIAVAHISAQNAEGDTITCRITVDGQVVRELSSQGDYAVVSCAGEPIQP